MVAAAVLPHSCCFFFDSHCDRFVLVVQAKLVGLPLADPALLEVGCPEGLIVVDTKIYLTVLFFQYSTEPVELVELALLCAGLGTVLEAAGAVLVRIDRVGTVGDLHDGLGKLGPHHLEVSLLVPCPEVLFVVEVIDMQCEVNMHDFVELDVAALPLLLLRLRLLLLL